MESSVAQILLVEDSPDDAILVRRALERERRAPVWFRMRHAATLQQALDFLGKGGVDVVLLDLHLPDSQGVDTVTSVREAEPRVPIVVFTVAGDDEVAVRALQAGAQDYLVKDEIAGGTMLHRAIRYAIERMKRHRVQQRLLQAEKLESLGVLAAGTASGFKTLLGSSSSRRPTTRT